MLIKKYGIYIVYGPIKNFTTEGLGRQLGYFLASAQDIQQVKFVILAPTWFQKSWDDLVREFHLREEAFEFITPNQNQTLISIIEYLQIIQDFTRKKIKSKESFFF